MNQESRIFALPNEEIDPRIHIFRRIFINAVDASELQVDAYVLQTQRFLIFCDTLLCPADAAFMAEHVQTIAPPQSPKTETAAVTTHQWLVINSHSDWDHVWGNSYFTHHPGQPILPIIGHTNNAARQTAPATLALLEDYKQNNPLFADVIVTPPNIQFGQQMSIDGGDLTLELLHAPGHCADHIAIWLPELRTLLAFDAVEWPFPSIADPASVPAFKETLQRFLWLEPHYVLCSHGSREGVEGRRILKKNYRYLRRLEENCLALLARQQPTEEMIEQLDCADLIGFAYDEASAGIQTGDEAYYRKTHQDNVRHMLRFLLQAES
jgi:Zn-dependent hydrolases, including glyoxylases